MPRIVMHIDMDCFFAQCEEVQNPKLKGKPLAVCIYSRRGGDSGAVSTSNYEARKIGVKSGMAIAIAKRIAGSRCAFIPANFELYEKASQKMREILMAFGEKFEQASIDEAYLEVTEKCKGDFSKAKELGEEIKAAVLKQERLTCSVGIGPNKLIAKMACDSQKPNGLTVIEPEGVKDFLFPLPVKKILGIGPKTEEMLKEMGILDVGELAKTDTSRLVTRFGKATAAYLHNAANGIDDSPVEEKEQVQISRITSLRTDSRDEKEMLELLDEMAQDVVKTVNEQKVLFRTITLQIITENMKMHTRGKTLEGATDSLSAIKNEIRALLFAYLEQNPENIRRIGVRVSGFEKMKGQRTLEEF
jgi:DNA polymerase IV (DinB-like DNA polymerase)